MGYQVPWLGSRLRCSIGPERRVLGPDRREHTRADPGAWVCGHRDIFRVSRDKWLLDISYTTTPGDRSHEPLKMIEISSVILISSICTWIPSENARVLLAEAIPFRQGCIPSSVLDD